MMNTTILMVALMTGGNSAYIDLLMDPIFRSPRIMIASNEVNFTGIS